ncbi:ATPase family protein 2 homolog [Actinia tenebrosa]|uniref:non-chaperonin molecular chaperone ATPase n=1 Tax=Actinia tenebrosa TaxID=6105 RepID=A0A6P8HDS6_ACTTE|nr:ATPase family protein 2 homolog [Actinia tenebrosa]
MSKKRQEIWQVCEICGRLVYVRHVEDHKTLCDGRGIELLDKYCFIEDGVLYGRVVDRQAKLITDSKFPLPSRDDIILLNINTMRTAKICIGGKVLLKSQSNYAVCLAWPSSSISPECVALSSICILNCKLSSGDPIQVSKLNGICMHASKVELQLCNQVEFEVNKSFTNYCLQQLDGHHISEDDFLDVTYYGQARRLKVLNVSGPKNTTSFVTLKKDKSFGIANMENRKTESNCDDKRTCGDDSSQELSQQLLSLSLNAATILDGKNQKTSNVDNSKHCKLSSSMETDSLTEQNRTNESTIPHDQLYYYVSSDETFLTVVPHGTTRSSDKTSRNKLTFSSIGGLGAQVQAVREMVEMPLKHPELFSAYGVPPSRGVLLYGPSGTGKTMVARAVANETRVHFICINGPDILSRYYGESEARLREIFSEAEEQAPSIVFIDEIDALCPRRDKVQNEFEKRVVATLLTLMDGMDKGVGHVMVLAATNRPDALDPALRRPGRFDREIEIGIPNVASRREIITTVLRNVPNSLRDDEITSFADTSHGYVGADLAAVCKEAGLLAFKRCLGNENRGSSQNEKTEVKDERVKNQLLVTSEDMKLAFRQVRPSAMREVALDIPKVRWNDVGGNKMIKQKLREAVEWPLKHPEAFHRMGIRPPRGILMYGPPGCSKTLIARALATETGLNFIAIKGPELFSKWVGESEKAIREVFRKARAAAPSIVFFDEIDAVAVQRGSDGDGHGSSVSDRVLTQLLTELDGVETLKDVILIAATNRPDMIDKALMRPGRLDRVIYVPLPDWDTREDIIRIHLKRTPCGDDVKIEDLGERTEGYSGAEIAAVCKEAALSALEEDIQAKEVRWRHFEKALSAVKPRINMESTKFYDKFQQRIGIHSI